MKNKFLFLNPQFLLLPLLALLVSPVKANAQLTLPFSQSTSTSPGTAAFSITNNGSNGYALEGRNNNYIGVYGYGAYGIYGQASASGPFGYGVYGDGSNRDNSVGMYGNAGTGSRSYGVYGSGGSANGNYGVYGYSGSGTGSYAVYGYAVNGYSAYFTGGTNGNGVCSYTGGADWNCTSDGKLKENFTTIDVKEILQRVSQLPITRWNMKGEKKTVKHIGPTAQDFHAAFKLGDNDKSINRADVQGVALAAIKGLYQVVQEKDAKIQKQEAEIAQLHKQMDAMEAKFTAKLTSLEQVVHANSVPAHQHRIVAAQSKLGTER